MVRRREPQQNRFIARKIHKFFDELHKKEKKDGHGSAVDAGSVAEIYGRFILRRRNAFLKDKENAARPKYYVGLSADIQNFADLTKRSTLVTDTLLLSHGSTGQTRRIHREGGEVLRSTDTLPSYLPVQEFFMQCPDFGKVGRWVLNSELLMRAGLAWYLPRFKWTQIKNRYDSDAGFRPRFVDDHFDALDYLISDGRAVDMSGASPEKSEFVRPILQIDLPFIEGVDLKTFGKITIDEFEAYLAFRRFLRREFINIDRSINSVQSQRELDKISLAIEDQVHAMKAEMNKVRRKRAVAVSGACVGTVTTILAAVYGPAFKEVIQMLGASGGAWGVLTAIAENTPHKTFREDKWYYVWALQREAKIL